MARKSNYFSTAIVFLCCLVLSLPPVPVSALDSEPPEIVESIESPLIGDSTGLQIEEDEQTTEIVTETQQNEEVDSLSFVTNDDTAEDTDPVGEDDEPAEPTPPELVNYPGIVITQMQNTGGTNKSSEELLEIHNLSSDDMDLTGWSLAYAPAGSTSWSTFAEFKSVETDIGWRFVLPASASYLLGTNEMVAAHKDLEVDQRFSAKLANKEGRIGIFDADSQLTGGLAWGAGTLSVEGNPATMGSNGGLIERRLQESGEYQNTKDNQADFQDGELRQTYKIGQVQDLFDTCLNLPGIVAEVPDGWYRDDDTGMCDDAPPRVKNSCEGLRLTEVGANLDRQFIELHNSTETVIELGGCKLKTKKASVSYTFEDETLAAGDYRVVYVDDTDLTLIKTTSDVVYLLSEDETTEVDSTDYEKLSSGTSWALVGADWKQTYTVTPGRPNVYQQYLPCDAEYVRNTDTGRCNKIVLANQPEPCAANQFRNPATGRCKLVAAASTLTPCRQGQYRSPETNRCRNLVTASSTLVPCKAGQERNPETNRCRSIAATASTLKPCQPGQERNPDTNRCRKIQSTTAVAGASFPVEKVKEGTDAFVGWWALGGVLFFGLAYAGWEWRHEISRIIGRASQKV